MYMSIQTLLSSQRTLIMGILNVTPDSFSDGGQFFSIDKALIQVESLIADGADIIDIGAESTRPGALSIPVEEERRRLDVLLNRVIDRFDCPISLDTSKPEIAKMGIELGVSLINDVKGTTNSDMWRVLSSSDLYYVCMHMQHTPDIMQINPQYKNVVEEVNQSFSHILHHSGIKKEKLIFDPGIGFGKTLEQNLEVLRHIDVFKALGCPILVGTSRKSFIGALTGDLVSDRLEGTVASSVLACEYGASLLRVHDVKSIKRAMLVADAIRKTI